MAKTNKADGLEIEQDLDFQRKEWNVERWGWVFMGLVLLAALAGLFGGGPLSSAKAQTGSLQVQYDRFERLHSPASLVIRMGTDELVDGNLQISFDQNYLSNFEVSGISPEPQSVEIANNRLIYSFLVSEPGSDAEITFKMQADRIGGVTGQVRNEISGETVSFEQFIYP